MTKARWWIALALLPVAAAVYGSFMAADGLISGIGGPTYYLILSGAIGVGYATVIGLLGSRVRNDDTGPLLDPVTGLPGTALVTDRLQQALLIGERDGSQVPLVIMGLDRFSSINNALGRDEGDVLLASLARRLESTLRESDTLARLSGDEFAILLPSSRDGHDGATAVTDKIRKVLAEPFVIGGVPVEISASFGIAVSPTHGRDAKTLIRNAAGALGAAKHLGSRVEFYSPGQQDLNSERLSMAAELRHAIDEKQLILFYQPKTSMKGAGIHGVEALVRWVHPERGMVMPNDFIPLAEQTDLMKPLTLYVLDEALRQVAVWRSRNIDLKVSVNISARNLSDTSFPTDVRHVIRATGAHPTWLELEVTESTVINDRSRAVIVLQELADMGIRIAIDDYGAGYTSLSYLTRLPIHALKIDKSFIQNMVDQQRDGLIVKSTIELGRGLGLEVVAEGVETERVWNRLVDLGCDYAQGYYVSRPMPADELDLN